MCPTTSYKQSKVINRMSNILNQDIKELIDQNSLFVISHSGGKDSQCLLIKLAAVLPINQMVVVHASLGEVEWAGALELAEDQANKLNIPFLVTKANKSFLEMVEHRFATNPGVPSWPSPRFRQCTSDLKRGPIQKIVREYAKKLGYKNIVNCMGIRAAESASRAKKTEFRINNSISNSVNTWYEWLPIHKLSTKEVFETIAKDGQKPHYAYELGNERLSCVFCIMGSKNDLINGAKHNPELLKKYKTLEIKTGYTMHASREEIDELAGCF